MRTVLAALALALLGTVALACTPAPVHDGGSVPPSAVPSSPALVSGIEGLVLAGPTCPVERAGQSPCVRPVQGAVILAFDSFGSEAGSGVADATGAYRIALPAGTYVVRPRPVQGTMGVGREQVVTVSAGAFTRLDIEYDTGIR